MILNFLAQKESVSRNSISLHLKNLYPVSKPTLARDLRYLVDKGLVEALGKGRKTMYKIAYEHPLLIPVDLVSYFAQEPDQRVDAKKSFDFFVFENLNNLFSRQEKDYLDKVYKNIHEVALRLDSTLYKRELERFVIELSWKSSKIEGNTYSLLETEALIKESQAASGHPKEEAIMILNHKTAFETILNKSTSFKKISLSDIERLHSVIVEDLSITKGLRKQAVGISGTVYKPLDNQWQIEEALQKTVNAINKSVYPLEKALIAAVMISYIQPFTDGNKRTARMLVNAILLAHDHYPLSYRSIDENTYKEALILFYETNNLYHFKRIFVEQYKFALRTYFL